MVSSLWKVFYWCSFWWFLFFYGRIAFSPYTFKVFSFMFFLMIFHGNQSKTVPCIILFSSKRRHFGFCYLWNSPPLVGIFYVLLLCEQWGADRDDSAGGGEHGGRAHSWRGQTGQFTCQSSAPDPDPHVFGPPGFGTISLGYGSWSRSFYHQAIIVRKILILNVLWLLLGFLSFKNYVNVPSKSNKQKKLCKKISFLLASWWSMTKIAGSGSGSTPKMSWIWNTVPIYVLDPYNLPHWIRLQDPTGSAYRIRVLNSALDRR